MTKEQYLLLCIAEECCEVGQRATKAARFGIGETQSGHTETNAERFVGELTDLLALVEKLSECDGRFPAVTDHGKIQKVAKYEKYLAYSQSIGQVDN